uniref:Uncharacterized protein n=1 Tax=Romanomermis culicivorax TaxID=13658 RepID=A0A915L2V0_ROMCU
MTMSQGDGFKGSQIWGMMGAGDSNPIWVWRGTITTKGSSEFMSSTNGLKEPWDIGQPIPRNQSW